MHLKFTVVLLFLSLTSCKCGLSNWFNGWSDELDSQNAKTKCREKREAEENGIKPDITKSPADKIVSLMDIEEGEPATDSERQTKGTGHQGNSKAKRCPKGRYIVSAYNPLLGAVRNKLDSLPLVKRDSTSEDRNRRFCTACMNQATCKLLGKCQECNKYCKHVAIFTNDLLTPWTNQTVGMANRITSTKKDDIFSKTLYPISTFREGETKNIICRIVGITDTSDIETVTIWVTTFSNKPPSSLNDMFGDRPTSKKTESTPEQNLRESENKPGNYNKMHDGIKSSLPGLHMTNGKAIPQEIKPRFNEYDDDDDDNASSGIRNNGRERLKPNPDVIEGPPSFLGSNHLPLPVGFSTTQDKNNLENEDIPRDITEPSYKPIVVQPKEFELDESDDLDNIVPSLPESSLKPIEEATTSKNVNKPTFLNRLRELTTSRSNKFPNLKGQGHGTEGSFPARGGFFKNLLKPRLMATTDNPSTTSSIIAIPSDLKPLQDPFKDHQNAPLRLPGDSEDQISKIDEALQEVKLMVKKVQEEASNASEKRLLGASHSASAPEDILQKDINTPSISSLPVNQIHPALPNHVADNIKKVNQYFINRAQDALDMIGPQEEKKQSPPPVEVDSGTDEHSDMTKNVITDLKKMPQFVLERFQDTLNGFDNKVEHNPGMGSNSLVGDAAKENVELVERFGGDDVENIDREENGDNSNFKVASTGAILVDDNDRGEAIIDIPKQSILENDKFPSIGTPTYKNKLEKYLTDLKEKRQRKYSPEKYLKSPSAKYNEITDVAIVEEDVKPANPSTMPSVNPQKNNLDHINGQDLEKQRKLLSEKLKKFIQEVKTKTSGNMHPIGQIDETTKKNIDHGGLDPTGNQDQSSKVIADMQTQVIPSFTANPKMIPIVPEEALIEIPFKNNDQIVGEKNSINNQAENGLNHFLPTIPNSGVDQITERPNKYFNKYLGDLRAKQFNLKPKASTDTNFIQNPGSESENQIKGGQDSKKNLLKDKIKNYVENLRKPTEETVGQPEMSLNQRMADQVSNLNNKVKNDMKNIFKSSPDLFKKDLLKEKLRHYIDSLKKPMGSILVPDQARKSSEAQREELNSLKRKLDSLLKANEPKPFMGTGTNPVISEAEANLVPSNSGAPLINNDIVPVISDAISDTNDNIVGDMKQSPMDDQFRQVNGLTPFKNQEKDKPDVNLESRGSFNEGDGDLDWSHSLGKIVQSSSQPKDIFFIGNGIKLPLKVTQGPDGAMDLSVDLEKLCSCYNSSCSKNQTAIEETVGAILDKEAELNEQLKSDPLDDVKIEPIHRLKPFVYNKAKLKHRVKLNAVDTQMKKANIFKRSSDIRGIGPELTTINSVLERLKKNNEKNLKNNILKEIDLPKLPTLRFVTKELTDLGKKVQDSFSNSVQQLKNNVEELKDEMEDTFVGDQQNSNNLLNQDFLNTPTYNGKQIEDNLRKIKEKAEEMNNDVLQKIQHENTLNNLLVENGLQKNIGANPINNEYINSLEPGRMFKDLLKANGLNQIDSPKLPALNPLKEIKNSAIRNIEQQNTINKLIRKASLNKFQLPNIYTTEDPLALINKFQENLKKTLPSIPELQNRMNEINDDVIKIADSYQFDKANVLKKKLEQLDDEIEKYYESDEKLLASGTQKLFGGQSKEVVEKEVNIINKILSWIKSLASGIKEKTDV